MRDGERERRHQKDQERRDRGIQCGEVHPDDLLAHQEPDDDQCRAPWPRRARWRSAAPRRCTRQRGRRRRRCAGLFVRPRRRPRPTRCTTSPSSRRRPADDRAQGVDSENRAEPWHASLAIVQIAGLRNRGDRANRVEEIDHDDRQQQRQRSECRARSARSAWKTVSNRGIRSHAPAGHCDTPRSSAAAVAVTMPMTIAPGTLFESRNAMISRPASARAARGHAAIHE